MSEKYEYEKKCFKENTKNHQIEIVLDQGVHRHIRFKSPDNNSYWFDLVTWNGYLCISGDMGCYTFSRLNDMFELFRSNEINPGYWGKKLQSGSSSPKNLCTEWSQKEFNRHIRECLNNALDGLTLSEAKELVKHTKEEFSHCYDEYSSIEAIQNYSSEYLDLCDFFDNNCTEFTYHYLWCCYAIVWAIQQYDNFKSEVLMHEKLISFNEEMLKAILDGRKTQTRRAINANPCEIRYSLFSRSGLQNKHGYELLPKYTVGDILLVKDNEKISLKITNVKAERLQDITEQDAIAEGIKKDSVTDNYCAYPYYGIWTPDPIQSFMMLWDSIYSKDDSKRWEANPYVWVYEFERVS